MLEALRDSAGVWTKLMNIFFNKINITTVITVTTG